MNYTKDQTDYIVGVYESEPTMEVVNELAEELGKSPKSIIGKLSREGVYKRNVYVTKSGVAPVTKIELVTTIANNSMSVAPTFHLSVADCNILNGPIAPAAML